MPEMIAPLSVNIPYACGRDNVHADRSMLPGSQVYLVSCNACVDGLRLNW